MNSLEGRQRPEEPWDCYKGNDLCTDGRTAVSDTGVVCCQVGTYVAQRTLKETGGIMRVQTQKRTNKRTKWVEGARLRM